MSSKGTSKAGFLKPESSDIPKNQSSRCSVKISLSTNFRRKTLRLEEDEPWGRPPEDALDCLDPDPAKARSGDAPVKKC